jgi:hypothetical protein
LLIAPADAFAQDGTPHAEDKPREFPNYHYFTQTPRRDTALQNFRFSVTVRGGDRLLWAGDLWLSEYEGARVETDLQDVNPKCGFEQRRKKSRNSGLVLTLTTVDRADDYGFWLRAYWEHRLPQCDAPRSVNAWISIPVELTEGETKTFEGDSGLTVEVTRRDWRD